MSKPTYIYKLVPASSPPPEPLPERLPVSDLDTTSGYLHMSTAVQVPLTLKRFFADDSYVYILRVPYEGVEGIVKWESTKGEEGQCGGEGMFPHIYNEFKLGRDEVESVAVWQKGEDNWDTALKSAEKWLLY